MKIVVNINQKIGQPKYGSFGAGCSFELDIDDALLKNDPASVLSHSRLLGDLARAAVDRELDLQRKKVSAPGAPAEREPGEPGEDDEDDNGLRPGDSAYERNRPARGRDNRPPDNRSEEQRRQGFEDRQRAYREYVGDDGAREERRPDRRDDRRQGPPRNGRQFAGWINKQPEDVLRRAKRLVKEWNFPTMFIDLEEGEVSELYRELIAKPESASHRNGSSNGNGNGRGGY